MSEDQACAAEIQSPATPSSGWKGVLCCALVRVATNGPGEHSKHHFADAHALYILSHHLPPISWRAQGGWVIRFVDGFSTVFFSCIFLQIGTHSPKRRSVCAGHVALEQTLPLSLPPQVCSPLGQLPAQIKTRVVPGATASTTSALLHCDLVSCSHVRSNVPIVQ